MRLSQKLFVACVILAIFCVPSSAEDLINTSLVAFGQATLIVNVDGELSNALSDTFVPGNAATITAPNVAGKTFNYWTNDEGRIISYNKELPLIIHSDTGLNAVYSTNTVTAVPVAEFLTVTKSASQILFNVIATVPSGTTITEYGIRYSTTKNTLEALKGTDGVTVEKAGNSDSNWLFFVPGSDDTTCYAVAYVISGGQTYYSNVITANLSALNSGLSFLPGAIYLPLGEEFDVEKTPDLRGLLKERVFNIAFDPNNGTGAMSPQGVRKNTPTTLNANKLKRDNYSFIGWNTKADGTGTSYQDSANVSLTGSMKLYAQWKANEYEISYDLNGGSVTIANPKSYDITTATFKLNNPTKEGYTFTGWTGTDLTGTSTDVRIPLGSAGNREYTATWKTIEYSISYTLNNGSVSGNPASYTIESDAITLNNPTKNGYTFTGWTGTDLSGKTQTVTVAKGSTENRSYTANFSPITYTISYELNGGSVTTSNPTSYDIETATFTLTQPTKTGYSFEGWTGTGLTGATKVVTIAVNSTGNRSYKANWTLIQYGVSFDLNGGVFEDGNPTSYNSETDTFTLKNPTRDGYEFIGWNRENESELSLNVEIQQGTTGNLKYIANWKTVKYSLNYELNGGTVSPDNPEKYTVESEDIKLIRPTKKGYSFTGWSFDNEISIDITLPKGSTGNREYAATWTAIEYTISYTLNNGSVSGNPDNYTIESEAITLNNPSRNGYTFDGWTGTGLSGKTQSVIIASGSTGDRSYTANFTPITYTISYELNGGTNNAENPTSYTIESATVTLKAPTRDGYNFGGWTFNGEAISEIAQGSTGNKTLTATWVETHGEIKPVISPASYALTVYKGQSSSLTLNATGTNLKWDMSGSLPIGMTFSSAANSATISGTPETGTSGSYSVTVTAANALGSASANVTITVANDPAKSVDVEAGTPVTTTTENGGSMTTTQTAFKSGTGQTILTADVSITTESEDFEAVAGNPFTTTIKVDVSLNVADKNYNGYVYEMTLAGLPEWLIAEGELGSDDVLESGETQYHHEFTLTGTPPTSKDTETLTLTAMVKVSGDIPTLEASGSKEVNISVSSPDSERNSAVLQSMSVAILGDDTLTTNAGASSSITFTANVQGTYSDGQTRILPAGSYALTWSANDTELASYGFSFAEGTLRVNANAPAGTHEIQITATAVSSDVSGTGIKAVTVTVQSVADVPTVPVLTCATINTTVKRGATIAPLTVRADTTPQEWLPSGELPEGLSYTADGNKFVISGTVSQTLEARAYVYTVRARNEAGTSEAITLTITVTATGTATSERVEVSAGEISAMTDEEIVATLGNKTDIALTGNVENLSETIARLETVTNVKTLDLSKVTGVSELKLEQTTLESITLAGNQSIKTVAVTGNTTLTALNLSGSAVETVDAEGCENLQAVNVEGATNLTTLNVKATQITTLNVKDCANLTMLDAKGCANLESVNLEGCESLEYLDVSETKITELDVKNCANLETLNCASSGVKQINLEGCEKLDTLDCSYNSLLVFNASGLTNLHNLECSHQRVYNKPLARLMNFLDLLLGRGAFSSSATDENNGAEILSNVENLKAYDATDQELSVEFDRENGEVIFSGEPAKIGYDYATGFNSVMMDVEVYPSETQGRDNAFAEVGVAPGGCTFGFGIGALGALVLLMTLPRKKATE